MSCPDSDAVCWLAFIERTAPSLQLHAWLDIKRCHMKHRPQHSHLMTPLTDSVRQGSLVLCPVLQPPLCHFWSPAEVCGGQKRSAEVNYIVAACHWPFAADIWTPFTVVLPGKIAALPGGPLLLQPRRCLRSRHSHAAAPSHEMKLKHSINSGRQLSIACSSCTGVLILWQPCSCNHCQVASSCCLSMHVCWLEGAPGLDHCSTSVLPDGPLWLHSS